MTQIPTNPDFHFLLFAPGLETWVFEAANRYWATFRPVLYSMRAPDDVLLVTYATGGSRQVAVTLAMRRDTAATIRAAVAAQLPDVYLDPLVYDAAIDLQLTLNGRATLGQRFGLPPDSSSSPQATRTPGPIQLP